jgi:hypothetical protein
MVVVLPDITRRQLLGSAAVGAGGILAYSVLPTGLARAASLAPGETWIGNRRAHYARFLEQEDPAHPRTQDTTWKGRQCIAFWVYNQDLGPDAIPPGDDKNPRAQAESSTFMKRGGHYIIDHFAYIKPGNLPVWQGGWLNLWEKYGPPFEGSPPLSVKSHDGQHWGFYQGQAPWGTNFECPITYDSWQQWTFDFVNDDPGPLTVSLNGKVVFSDPAYRNINDSDRDGNWMTVPHLYMERNHIVPDGVQVGPIWMYDVVRQLG